MRKLSSLVLVGAFAVTACDGSQQDQSDTIALSDSALTEGTPDAIGFLAFLNSSTTTFYVLDVSVDLDARAAKNLIAHRDGKDGTNGTADDNKYDNLPEVDGIAYVGTSALDKIMAYARSHSYVPTGSQTLGTYDGILFTADDAAATLNLVNTATTAHLDNDLKLDARAVKNMVAARPIASVLALSKISYVGTATLRTLKSAATAAPTQTLPKGVDVAAHLGAASAGLEYGSESDYPFTVIRIPGAGANPITAANVKAIIAPTYTNRPDEATLDQREIEVISLQNLLDRYTIPQDFWEDSDRAAQPAWQALENVFQTQLIDVQVFRFGERSGNWLEGSIDVYIIGRTVDGEVVGLSTISVET